MLNICKSSDGCFCSGDMFKSCELTLACLDNDSQKVSDLMDNIEPNEGNAEHALNVLTSVMGPDHTTPSTIVLGNILTRLKDQTFWNYWDDSHEDNVLDVLIKDNDVALMEWYAKTFDIKPFNVRVTSSPAEDACLLGRYDIVKYFFDDHLVDDNVFRDEYEHDNNYEDCFFKAIKHDHRNIAEYILYKKPNLIKNQADTSFFPAVAFSGNSKMMVYLIEKGEKIKTADDFCISITMACKKGHLDILNKIIEITDDKKVFRNDEERQTKIIKGLKSAIVSNQVEVIKALDSMIAKFKTMPEREVCYSELVNQLWYENIEDYLEYWYQKKEGHY